jgi:hypothetical protein
MNLPQIIVRLRRGTDVPFGRSSRIYWPDRGVRMQTSHPSAASPKSVRDSLLKKKSGKRDDPANQPYV